MKIKVTIEVGSDSGSIQVDQKEVDLVLIGVLGGIMKKYEGRITNINDSYGEQMHGQIVKSKMVTIIDE